MNCKAAGIDLCPACVYISSFQTSCWIDWYGERLAGWKAKNIVKDNLLDIIKSDVIKVPQMIAAVKEYLPEYSEWFEKMLVLR